ncbi:MAG TPA: PilC/PilY family type IV pilus protein [Methylomirabilota bacterium]|nr:PilC/PilY family type IV pilus protein [Methylomirabilota bacterium]
MKRLIALVLIGTFLSLQIHPAVFADDSDIFGANIQPNVLILLDNSGSMADQIVSEPYVAATSYTVVDRCGSNKNSACSSPVVYKSGSKNTYTKYADTIAAVNKAAAETALSTVGYWSGKINGSNVDLFVGNYLNYQIGFCANGACTEAKIDIAKSVLKNLVDTVTGVRFGFMKFYGNATQGTGGGSMVAQMGTNATAMKTAIDNITPTGFTPLGEFLRDGGRYYKGQTLTNGNTYTSPIQLECQPSFIILVSDGLQNGSMDVRTEATNRFTQDHASTFTGTQNVIVHTVGFDLAGDAAANDVLQTAASNGGGQFYTANNQAELESALQDAIRRIVAATFTFATPVVPTTSTTGSTKAYLAAFQSDPSRPFWKGYLKAYQRDSNGLVPIDANGVPLSSALVWEAGQVLSGIASSSRTIKTVASLTNTTSGTSTVSTGSLTSFDKSNSAITQSLLGVTSSTERDRVIDFLRGVDVLDEDKDGNTTEDRSWKLGDIFHATPVLITPPVLALNDSSYQAFKTAQASRTKILLAGANDGMIHAFRESDGTELWAFIPPDLLDNLKNLESTSGDHLFYVDASPIAADIKIGGVWKTIVVFGLRRGGKSYYALDITNTTSPSFLWAFTDTKMGETWSEPAIGKVNIGGADKFVMFVGGGYDTAQNNATGKAFFAVDLSNGSKLFEYYNSGGNDNAYMNFSIAANPTAVDLNNNGYVDRVYVGDVGGQVWKFDVSATDTALWTGKRLFAAASSQTNPPVAGEYYPAQGIYGAPTLAFDSQMNLWLYVGTGDRNHPNNTSSNRFYGIKDDTTMSNGSTLTESNLANVTSTNGTASSGWFFQMGTNEKVFAAANVFNMDVLFSGFTPTTTVTCTSGGGTAKLYAVQMSTGYAAINFSTGTALSSTDATVTRSTTIGSGIASMPVIIVTPPPGSGNATASALTATTNQQLPNNPIPAPGFLKQVRSWRERVQ